MFFKNPKTWIVRSILILELLCGILGGAGVQPARAASLIVMNTNDSGPGSLRQAFVDAASGDIITFDPSLAGQTITLASDLILPFDPLVESLTIDGTGLFPQVTISGGNVAHIEFSSWTTTTISDLTIVDGYGSGIENRGTLTIIDSTLKNNYALGGGGAIRNSGTLTLKNSTITENQAGDGGAILSEGSGTTTIVNSTITKNHAVSDGGAISTRGHAEVYIQNSTIAANSADWGAEIAVGSSTNFISLRNTVIACDPEHIVCNEFMFSPEIINSIVDTGSLQDFGLAELADNGGPTQTMALLPGSLLIDAGDDGTCTGPLVNNLDQRGFSRSQGSHCDIGAYEYGQDGVLYVDQDASGSNNGLSWANAYTDLQDALAAASSGDEIWVATGLYKPTSGTDRSISFVLKNGVAVYGGFAGTETLRDQRDLVLNPTILSGDIGVVNNSSDNSYHVVVVSHTNNSAVLDSFVIEGGNANASPPHDKGGGIYNDRGSPTIMSVSIERNSATFGGGMYNGDTQNTMAPQGSHPVLVKVNFISNSAVEGGGMENQFSSSPSITDAFFAGNTAVRSGGGMLNMLTSSPTLTWVDFVGNVAAAGGGMANDQSSPTLTDVSFHQNSASAYGGGMSNDNGSNPVLRNVTFGGNTATDVLDSYGGGMSNFRSSPTLTNVTFHNNSATYGGGMLIRDPNSNPTLIHVTFSGNTAFVLAGGIANDGSPIIRNSILWGNTGGEIVSLTYTPDIRNSIVQGGYPGAGNLDADPLLGPLQNNGGLTETMALGAGSPAIDAGDDANCPANDQRSVNRPQGSHCDIGAYEYEQDGILYVDQDASGINNGLSWANAYTDVQDALAAASSGDEIWVAAGTYKPTLDSDRSISFLLKNGVELYGGFAGTETTLSQRNHITNLTILSGDIGVQDDISDNSYHVVVGSYTDTSAVLDGFTVTAGNANETQTDTGGGMLNYRGSPTVTNIIFTGNSAGRGGGMYNGGDIGAPIPNGSNPLLRNVTFSWNSAIDGGGMENQYGSSPVLVDVVFMYNTAIRSGGGMLNMGQCHANLMNASFIGNTAYAGGGMANFSSNSTLMNVLFNNNTAELGGGMFNSASSPSLTNVAFNGNTAISPGSEESSTNDSVDP